MLPLDEGWYRRLLVLALGFGAVGGIFALVYSAATGWGIGFLFGEPTSEPFSGQWWWVPLVSAGAVLVAAMRERAGVTGRIPGAVAYARKSWVDPSTAAQLTIISAVSLVVGASLGPSFGIIVSAGGFASWVASRHQDADESEKQGFALTGMAGGLGAVFAAPLFASVMASELSPTPKRSYVSAFTPQLLAATVGFVIYFSVTGTALMDAFDVPGYRFEFWHLAVAPVLGLLSAAVVLVYALIGRVVKRTSGALTNVYLKAALLGAIVGSIAFALPLTATGGSGQLAYTTDHLFSLGAGLLVVVMLAKIVAVVLSQEAGFLGGAVFPMLFIGGTAGAIVSDLVDAIPAGLAIAAMIAAVPGGIIGAPISFILIGAGVVGVGVEAIPAVGLAVATSHIAVSAMQLRSAQESV